MAIQSPTVPLAIDVIHPICTLEILIIAHSDVSLSPTGGVRVYLANHPTSRHHSPQETELPTFVDDSRILSSSFETVHPLDKCRDCHAYTRHVDQTFHSDLLRHKAGTFMEGIQVGRRAQLEEDSMTFSRYRGRLQVARKQYEELLFSNHRYRQRVESLEAELADLRDHLMATQMAYNDISTHIHGSPPVEWSHSYPRQSRQSSPSPPQMRLDDANDAFWLHDDTERETGGHSDATRFDDDDDDFFFAQQMHLLDGSDRREERRFWADLGNISSDSENDGYDTISSSSSSAISSSASDTPPSEDPESDDHHERLSVPPLEMELSVSELSTLIEAAQEGGNTDAVTEVKLLVQDAHRTPRTKRTAAQLYLLLTWRTPSWVSGSPRLPGASPQPYSAPIASTSQSRYPEIFVDASLHGIGLIFKDQWLAWKFNHPHPAIPLGINKDIIMSWAEIIAVELGVLTLIEAGYHNQKVVLRSDNLGVVNALREKRWKAHYDLNSILKRILNLCQEAGLDMVVNWVSTKVNPADLPSRGVFPPPELMFPQPPALPAHLSEILTLVNI